MSWDETIANRYKVNSLRYHEITNTLDSLLNKLRTRNLAVKMTSKQQNMVWCIKIEQKEVFIHEKDINFRQYDSGAGSKEIRTLEEALIELLLFKITWDEE